MKLYTSNLLMGFCYYADAASAAGYPSGAVELFSAHEFDWKSDGPPALMKISTTMNK